MQTNEVNLKKNKLKLDFKDSKYATGRRKTSIAKVWVKKGTGKIYVNGKLYNEYFVSENHKMQILPPNATLSNRVLEVLVPKIKDTILRCQELSKDPTNTVNRLEVVGLVTSIHWWLCQLCLFARGSASIANMFMYTLFQIAGLNPSGVSPGVCLDLEALLQDQDSYVESVGSLFCTPPERWEVLKVKQE